MSRNIPPSDDEFELSVLGPGRGECIILHLGHNNWCVVDSCVDVGKSEAAAVEYLSSLGQRTLDGVRLLVATHWHDDHIRGIASALRAFNNARFCCSIALNSKQFVALVELTSDALPGDTGLDEFANVYKILVERSQQTRGRDLVAPAFA
jgi:glyoxylase-like metal-dependent hydrolase (beta-lactamase superfamily II)